MKHSHAFIMMIVCVLCSMIIATKPAHAGGQGAITYADSYCDDFYLEWASTLTFVSGDTLSFQVIELTNNTIVYDYTFTFNSTFYGDSFLDYLDIEVPDGTFLKIIQSGNSVASQEITVRCTDQSGKRQGATFTDGRLNNKAGDAGQTATVYCKKDGTLEVYSVNNSKGTLAFKITKSEMEALIKKYGEKPNPAVLLKVGLDVRLYLLPSGELKVIGRALDPQKPQEEYGFIFNTCKV